MLENREELACLKNHRVSHNGVLWTLHVFDFLSYYACALVCVDTNLGTFVHMEKSHTFVGLALVP